MENKKTKYELLSEELGYKSKNIWEESDEAQKKNIFSFSEDYKNFLSKCKTEREVVNYFITEAESRGFKNLESINKKPEPNDKFYVNLSNKALILGVFGENGFEEGINIVGAHNDVPRLDLKQKPLFEDTELALLKTHYYGGIKKYQWVNIPLALHGVICLENGETKKITIGEDPDDPVFVISDLLPHLSHKIQGEKKLLSGIEAENLVIIAGNIPVKDKKVKEKVKLAILEKLKSEYGIIEEDFITAELEVVPAFKAQDIGFDRALIGGYGHDDRVCSYLAAKAIFDVKKVKRTSMALLMDKEEIGSSGLTGADSMMLYSVYSQIAALFAKDTPSSISKALNHSFCLSSDVSAAVNPMYKTVHDAQNAPLLSHGISLLKYTGSGGKYSSNDADPEFFAKLRKMLNENNIIWQYATLGKVDEGGGGTIAKFISYFGVKTIDAGVPVIGMHSPFEIISKADLWSTYQCYKVFYEKFRN